MRTLPIWIERRLTAPERGFGPACQDETSVYGARRPGFPLPAVSPAAVARWIATVRAAGVEQVVCLLPPRQLAGYADLLGAYRQEFGPAQVCWAPVEDFRLIERDLLLDRVLPALFAAERDGARSVVHCSGGIGRTGHVLAAWLVSARGLGNAAAIAAVRQTGRNPRESRDAGLDTLLDAARSRFG
jgi:hypothetical protein